MSAVRRSILFSALDKYATQVLLIATTAVMARILTPAETGLYLVANALLILAENLRDFGVATYLVQHPELSHPVLRAAFTASLIISVVVGGTILLGADAIAGFYGAPELSQLLLIGTIVFLVVPFGGPVLAVMRREMRFKTIAVLNVVAALVNSAVAIGLGLAGFGAASYVWAYVLANGLLSGLAIALHPAAAAYRPTLRGIGAVMSFGSLSAAVTLINMVYDLLPRLALGRILGFDAVGLYTRALTICQLPERSFIVALHPVVLPALAAQARAGRDLKASYLRGIGLLSGVQLPTLAMLAILANPAVAILLGAQWTEAPPLVRLLALGTMALAPGFMTYPLLIASGRIRDALLASLVSLPPSTLLLIVAAHHGGLPAVAAATLLTGPLQMAVALWFIRRAVAIDLADVVATLRASVVVTAATAAGPLAVVALSPHGFALSWLETAAACVAGGAGWALGIVLTRHPIGAEAAMVLRTIHTALPARLLPSTLRSGA